LLFDRFGKDNKLSQLLKVPFLKIGNVEGVTSIVYFLLLKDEKELLENSLLVVLLALVGPVKICSLVHDFSLESSIQAYSE